MHHVNHSNQHTKASHTSLFCLSTYCCCCCCFLVGMTPCLKWTRLMGDKCGTNGTTSAHPVSHSRLLRPRTLPPQKTPLGSGPSPRLIMAWGAASCGRLWTPLTTWSGRCCITQVDVDWVVLFVASVSTPCPFLTPPPPPQRPHPSATYLVFVCNCVYVPPILHTLLTHPPLKRSCCPCRKFLRRCAAVF